MQKSQIFLMALIRMGEFMTNISGKVGGTINSTNKGGPYAKNFAVPTNPRSLYQIGQRNNFTGWSQNWRNLTQAQRDSWIAFAASNPYTNRVGLVRHFSGSNLYSRYNINLQLVGATPLLVPPAASGVTAVTLVTPLHVAGVVTVAFTPTPVPAGTDYLVWATPGVSVGINNVNNKYRLIGFIAAAAVSPATITTMYTNRFGAQAVGTKVFIGLQPIFRSTGEMGLMLAGDTIVA